MILKKNEHLKTMKGTVVLAKENENAPARHIHSVEKYRDQTSTGRIRTTL